MKANSFDSALVSLGEQIQISRVCQCSKSINVHGWFREFKIAETIFLLEKIEFFSTTFKKKFGLCYESIIAKIVDFGTIRNMLFEGPLNP